MTNEILALTPSSLIEQTTPFNVNSSSAYRGPHCAICGHEVKGYRKVSQGALSPRPWSNACTIISLYTDLPDRFEKSYKELIILGNTVYEDIIHLPDNQQNMSVRDILAQLKLPLKDPGDVFNGIMFDGEAQRHFHSLIKEATKRPGLNALLFILNPVHSLIFCVNEEMIAVFDSHAFSTGHGAMVMYGPITKLDSILQYFHYSMKFGYNIQVDGGNYTSIELEK
eukprot:Seg2583.2 transcript_id=Seg2583.2/GoldUCD/mRNA.D3Y31 product="hypothetical protein" protein_id=Seg2583.2/GoldUCD/D3Y31